MVNDHSMMTRSQTKLQQQNSKEKYISNEETQNNNVISKSALNRYLKNKKKLMKKDNKKKDTSIELLNSSKTAKSAFNKLKNSAKKNKVMDEDEDFEPLKEGIRQAFSKALGIPINKNNSQIYNSYEDDYFNYNVANEEYLLKLKPKDRKRLKKLEKEVEKINSEKPPNKYKILDMPNLDIKTKAVLVNKNEVLEEMEEGNGEYYKLKEWLDSLMRVPFGKYYEMEVKIPSEKDSKKKIELANNNISNYMFSIQKQLDSAVYGHDEAKNVILELIGQWITNPDAIPQVIALQGPPGNGKTSLAKEGIAKALNRPFRMISLGGATDSSYLDGFGFTFEGSMPGRIVSILQETQCMNPVVFFDELDKVSDSSKGHEIIGALTHLTDPTQNHEWHDKYFSGIDFDLSKALFIFSFNDENSIHPVLKDRIRIIRTKGHDTKSKLVIAKDYMIPRIMDNIKMKNENIIFDSKVLEHIISTYTNNEKGVRKLKQCLESIIMKINIISLIKKGNIEKEKPNIKFDIKDFKLPITITNSIADSLIKDMKMNGDDQPPEGMYV